MPVKNGFTIETSPFAKVRGGAEFEAAAAQPGTVLEAIVKVSEPGYVPPGLTLRTWIGDLMMTAETAAGGLLALDKDPKVESVSVSRSLRVIR